MDHQASLLALELLADFAAPPAMTARSALGGDGCNQALQEAHSCAFETVHEVVSKVPGGPHG